MTKKILQKFFDTVVWYGTPFVREFVDNHAEDLRADCSKEIWKKKGLGFKPTAHFAVLENDYQYLLAFVTYRFAELGAYEFVLPLYERAISHISEAVNLLKIWKLTSPKFRCCFTEFGVSCGLLSEEVKKEFKKIVNENANLVCGKLAKILLDESYIREQELSGRDIKSILNELGYNDGLSLTRIINSPLCDGNMN